MLFILITGILPAQDIPEKALLNSLKADKLEVDLGNGDGVFRARIKKTKKWGMYQWTYTGTKCEELIPPQYDSLRFFPFNGTFTIVYQQGKAGVVLSPWSYDNAHQTVSCSYDCYQRFTVDDRTYLAVHRAEGWGWVNWLTGAEMSEFIYATKDDLPYPQYFQAYSPSEQAPK